MTKLKTTLLSLTLGSLLLSPLCGNEEVLIIENSRVGIGLGENETPQSKFQIRGDKALIEAMLHTTQGAQVDGTLNVNGTSTFGIINSDTLIFSAGVEGDVGINMSNKKITNLPEPTADGDAATKKYVDGQFNTDKLKLSKENEHTILDISSSEEGYPRIDLTSGDHTIENYHVRLQAGKDLHYLHLLTKNENIALGLSSKRIIYMGDPIDPQDAATKKYVDDKLGSGFSSESILLAPQSTYPATPSEGQIFNNENGQLLIYSSGEWKSLVTGTTVEPAVPPETPNSNDLSLHYSFNEANPLSNLVNPGQNDLINTNATITSDSDPSIEINASSSSYAKINGSITIPTSYTIAFWCNPTDATTLSSIISTSSNREFYLNNGTVTYSDPNMTGGTQAVGTIADNEWTHLAVTKDQNVNEIKIYMNGSLITTKTMNGTEATSQDFYLGRWHASGYHYSGKIDEFVFYTKALTQAEITQLQATKVSTNQTTIPYSNLDTLSINNSNNENVFSLYTEGTWQNEPGNYSTFFDIASSSGGTPGIDLTRGDHNSENWHVRFSIPRDKDYASIKTKNPEIGLDIDNKKIINLKDPTNSQDAATKSYVDSIKNLIYTLTETHGYSNISEFNSDLPIHNKVVITDTNSLYIKNFQNNFTITNLDNAFPLTHISNKWNLMLSDIDFFNNGNNFLFVHRWNGIGIAETSNPYHYSFTDIEYSNIETSFRNEKIQFVDNGNKIFLSGYSTGSDRSEFKVYSVSSPFTIENPTVIEHFIYPASSEEKEIEFFDNGNKFLLLKNTSPSNTLELHSTSNSYTISNSTLLEQFTFSTSERYSLGEFFDNGNKLLISSYNSSNTTIYIFTVNTAYSLNGLTISTSFNVNSDLQKCYNPKFINNGNYLTLTENITSGDTPDRKPYILTLDLPSSYYQEL